MDQNQDYQKVLDDYAKATLVDVNPTPTPAPVPEPVVPPATPPTPTKTNSNFDIFKYAFFLSLFIFLGVVTTLAYNLYKQYFSNSPATVPPATSSMTSESPTPSVVATPTSTAVCQLNDKSYHIDETFPAADGCNTCTCGSDLTISCTELDCSSSTIPADWKTYTNAKSGISFNYPKDWKVNSPDIDTIDIQSTVDPAVDLLISLNMATNPLPTFAPLSTPTPTSLGSVSVKKVSYLDPYTIGQVYIYIPTKNITIHYQQSAASSTQLTIDQILSTFKFL